MLTWPPRRRVGLGEEGPSLGAGRGPAVPSPHKAIGRNDAIPVQIIFAVIHPRVLQNHHSRRALQPFILVPGTPAHPAPRHDPPDLDLTRPQVV